jgi:hypothetical protein
MQVIQELKTSLRQTFSLPLEAINRCVIDDCRKFSATPLLPSLWQSWLL